MEIAEAAGVAFYGMGKPGHADLWNGLLWCVEGVHGES